jgi:hypothetical protein
MASIDAVHLRGGPCDGERPEPFDGDFPDTLVEIAVMDYAASVGHVYRVTADHLVDEAGVTRTVLDFRRTVPREAVTAPPRA